MIDLDPELTRLERLVRRYVLPLLVAVLLFAYLIGKLPL